jgi:hypothetical protein
MESKMIIDTIVNILAGKLKDTNFAFIGSINLYLQGLDVKPRDIDILTTPEDIKKIDKILAEYRTKDIYYDESEGRNSWRSFYEINGIEIEILGNVNNLCRDPKSLDQRITILHGEHQVPCVSLENELKAYKKMGRDDKVRLIQDFLNGLQN